MDFNHNPMFLQNDRVDVDICRHICAYCNDTIAKKLEQNTISI